MGYPDINGCALAWVAADREIRIDQLCSFPDIQQAGAFFFRTLLFCQADVKSNAIVSDLEVHFFRCIYY